LFSYPNGLSISLPREVQDRVMNSLLGLQNAKIIQYGYAVEYDYVDPRQLTDTLETKKIPGLYVSAHQNLLLLTSTRDTSFHVFPCLSDPSSDF
jgi:tRNA U34 5-carboxymethylaminomethyl modifying enzyme MnmG/GidA